MATVSKTSLAEEDLEELWLTIALDNPPAADRVLDDIAAKSVLLSRSPLLGRARPELGHELRSFPVGRYIIFYVPQSEGIEIVRVLDAARDVDAILSGEQDPS